MTTLRDIRSKGPLLVIVIGLVLFAFIAGDAWRVPQPHQSHDVGEVNGETLSAQDYQNMVEEHTEVIKFSGGMNSLNDKQTNQVKNEVWRNYTNNRLVEKEVKKLGVAVSKTEIQSIINEGVNPLLQQTPLRNPQTGAFDKDMLKKSLFDYSKMNKTKMPSQYVEYYEGMHKLWPFVEKTLIQSRLAGKHQALVTKALFSNSAEAQDALNARVNQSDVLLIAMPYSSIVDSTITVKESKPKDLYDKKKEQFEQYVKTHNIKYIDIQVTASVEDEVAIQQEVTDYTNQLATTNGDYTTFVRSTRPEYPYVDLYYTERAFLSDVVARMDSTSVGQVYGPYYNVGDNTINSFKVLSKVAAADSVQSRQIQVYAEDAAETKVLVNSIYTAVKGGTDLTALTKKCGQASKSNWISSANYENAQVDGDNLRFITTTNNLGVNELSNVALGQGNIILQITDKKVVKDKYKAAVIKRAADFSKETYNRAYNDFSQFIATNPTVEKMAASTEETGHKLLERNDLYSSEHGIGGIRGTKEALKWAFATKPGEVSGLYECGESDRMLVVDLVNVIEKGYRPLAQVQDQLRAEIIHDKKAEKIMADMKAANATSFDRYKSIAGTMSDSVKRVTSVAPAYVIALHSSEPLVGTCASVADIDKLSAPTKGNDGVFMLQVYAKDRLNETFDVKAEEVTLEDIHACLAARFMNDLYLKGDVKDKRYLFF